VERVWSEQLASRLRIVLSCWLASWQECIEASRVAAAPEQLVRFSKVDEVAMCAEVSEAAIANFH
jgi:hypothetical protein